MAKFMLTWMGDHPVLTILIIIFGGMTIHDLLALFVK